MASAAQPKAGTARTARRRGRGWRVRGECHLPRGERPPDLHQQARNSASASPLALRERGRLHPRVAARHHEAPAARGSPAGVLAGPVRPAVGPRDQQPPAGGCAAAPGAHAARRRTRRAGAGAGAGAPERGSGGAGRAAEAGLGRGGGAHGRDRGSGAGLLHPRRDPVRPVLLLPAPSAAPCSPPSGGRPCPARGVACPRCSPCSAPPRSA